MPFRRPLRRELAAASVALVSIASVALAAWLRADPSHRSCCPGLGTPSLSAPIAADPYLRSDTLANGLRYYIRENHAPGERIEVRLVIDAGSVQEDEDQRGLAHAVEHMVFRGTRAFPGRTMDRYLDGIGMRRGDGANATTTYDETVFRLTVPGGQPRALDTALAMIAGIAHEALFDATDARAEAGIVLEEWRSKRNARQRAADEERQIFLTGSRYAERRVIGDTAVLRRFDLRAMRRYYDRWYRPELMAVVVVGGMDADEVTDLIARNFRDIPRGAAPVQRPARTVTRAPGLRAWVNTDVEATGTEVAVWHPRAPIAFRQRADYRAALVAGLWRAVLAARLDDAVDEEGSPLLGTSVEVRRLARPLVAHVVTATAMKDRAGEALDVVTTELAHLARDGATRQEVDARAAAALAAARASAEAGEVSDELAAEFVDRFLTGNAPVSRAIAYDLARELLPTITAGDVTEFARGLALDSGAVVIVTATPDDGAAAIRPTDLVARARTASTRPVHVRRAAPEVTALVTPEPTRGLIASEHAIENVQAWEWVLSNGMHVILKPTRFTFDEIQVRAVAPGGASLAADADYPSAWLADAIIQNTGVGALSGVRLERMLDSTSISLAPTVSDDMIMLSGSTAPRDLKTFFQVLHLYFTAPRGDTVAFRRYRDRMQAAAASRDRDPDAVFLDTVAAVASGHHPRRLRSGVHFYESTRLPAAIAFWKARVANASGFTVVVTGDFTLDDMRPLVERYLASLPAGHPEQPRSVGFRADPGVVRREVVAGVAGRARTRIVLSGPIDVTSRAVEDLREVKDLVESSLDERLREAMGATYGVQVGSEVDLVPPTTYSLFVDFEASPERIDAVGAAALEELERLRTQGPTAAEFDRTRAARMRDYDGELESNDYWTSELSQHSRLGWPLTTIATHRQDVEGLEPATLRAAAATYLSTRRMTRVTTRPRAARPR